MSAANPAPSFLRRGACGAPRTRRRGAMLNEAREIRTPTLPVDSRMLSPIELWPQWWSTAVAATTTDAASSGSRVSSCPSARRAGRRGPRSYCTACLAAFPGPSLVKQRREAGRVKRQRPACIGCRRGVSNAPGVERWRRYDVGHRCSNPAPVFVSRCPSSGSCAILLCPSCDRERSRFAGILSTPRCAPTMVAERTTAAFAPATGVLQLAPASARPRSARGVRAVAKRGSQFM